MIKIEEVSSLDKLREMENSWSSLLEANDLANIFLRFDWLTTWWRYFSKDSKLFILNVMDDDELIGIAPLTIKRHLFFGLPVRTIFFMGTLISDRMDFILTRCKRESLLAILSYIMKHSSRWDYVDLQEIPRDKENLGLLKMCLEESVLDWFPGPSKETYYFPIEKHNGQALKSLLERTENRIKRIEKKARKLSGGLSFTWHDGRELPPESLIADMEEIESLSWKGKAQCGIFSDKRKRFFHQEIIRKFSKEGLLSIRFLGLNDRKIAYLYCYSFSNVLYGYNMAYDARYGKLSPGTTAMIRLLKDASSSDIERVDLLRGDEEWKKDITGHYIIHERIRIFHKGIYSNFLHKIQSRILPYLKSKKLAYRAWTILKETQHVFKRKF